MNEPTLYPLPYFELRVGEWLHLKGNRTQVKVAARLTIAVALAICWGAWWIVMGM